MENTLETNPQLQLAFDFVQYTNLNIFLTGKAGTGKTTFLQNLRLSSPKRMIVVAPTGVAAINAGGVTIHSFFQMHFGPHIPESELKGDSYDPFMVKQRSENIQKFNREKINIIKSLDLLVIDEISMVRADLLDGVDEVLRRFRDHNKPFGGVQLLLIGDLQQLAPVAKEEEWELLRKYYDTVFFFSSKALQRSYLVTIELKHIFRQSDPKFINLLNKVRNSELDDDTIEALHERYIPNFDPEDDAGYITLTTHNHQANQLNSSKLEEIVKPEYSFVAKIEGNFPEYSYPVDAHLVFKKGAQVMFVKNDLNREKRYYNGKIGKITSINSESIMVKCPGDAYPIEVEPVEWQNFKYAIDETTKEIKETIEGTFTQIPLKLAWAITIHKSQGLTFEKAIIDANAAFAHGQVYVALSRCKSFEGMVLSSKIASSGVKSDHTVKRFSQQAEDNQPTAETLINAKVQYQRQLLAELIDFTNLGRRLQNLKKVMRENKGSLPDEMVKLVLELEMPFNTHIVSIAEKFKWQITQLLSLSQSVEENTNLQERLAKGSGYFSEKLESILANPLQQLDLDVDNKVIKKQLKDAYQSLEQEIVQKVAVWKACHNGFYIKQYNEAKAKAAIEKPQKPDTAMDHRSATAKSKNPELYKLLKTWRNDTADELGCPYNMVVPQRTLHEISNEIPLSESALKKIHGVGKRTLSKFGKAILELTTHYYKNTIDDGFEAEPEPEIVPKKTKSQSLRVSLELFLEGKTIAQIAQERSLTPGTIESHLARFVESGELDVKLLIDAPKLKPALEWFDENPQAYLSDAREALGESYSWSELRFIKNHILWVQKSND